MKPFKLLWKCIFNIFYVIFNYRYYIKISKHMPRLFWYRLWIRKDEFHHSLNQDFDLMLDLNEYHRNLYRLDLIRRRQIAHNRSL